MATPWILFGTGALVIAGVAAPAAADCVVRGTHVSISDVVVRPASADDFGIVATVDDVSATATLPRRGPVALEIEGAIAFRGTRQRLWLTIATPVTAAGGMVQLAPGAHLVDARPIGDDVLATAVLFADDVLEGEDKAPEEELRQVRVPCAALTLAWAGDDAGAEVADEPEPVAWLDAWNDEADEPASGGDGTWWQPRRNRLALRAQPRDGATAIVMAAPQCEGCLYVEHLEERGRWLHVVRTGEGVRVTGWVRRAELTRVAEEDGVGRTYGCSGDHGGGSYGRSWANEPGAVYEGPATIKAGTRIYGAPDVPWAVVRDPDGFEVRAVAGEPWVTLTAIPGISGIAVLDADVPADAVTLPKP